MIFIGYLSKSICSQASEIYLQLTVFHRSVKYIFLFYNYKTNQSYFVNSGMALYTEAYYCLFAHFSRISVVQIIDQSNFFFASQNYTKQKPVSILMK